MKKLIGILDSGIGGVTVLKEILKIVPNCDYIYYSDSINNPYGEKSQQEIISYVDEIIKFFIKCQCNAIVFACNTATALAIDEMRKKYPEMIIIGTEPAYKMVYDYAKETKTLIMATPATINSKKFQSLYHKYNNHNTIIYSCDGLAKLIEDDDLVKIKDYLNKDFSKFSSESVETVVLGCTHYPLIKEEIKEVLGEVDFFDGSEGIARQLKRRLYNDNQEFLNKTIPKIKFIDSKNDFQKEKRFFKILEEELKN